LGSICTLPWKYFEYLRASADESALPVEFVMGFDLDAATVDLTLFFIF